MVVPVVAGAGPIVLQHLSIHIVKVHMDIGIKGAVTVGDIGDALNDVAIGVAVLVILTISLLKMFI